MTITFNVNTDQEAFDAVSAHLSQMTHRSFANNETGHGQCRYRANLQPDGNRCAIGALIPDEQYESWIDTSGATGVASWIREGMFSTTIDMVLLTELQRVHDDVYFWDNVGDGTVKLNGYGRTTLNTIAAKWGLTP